MISTIIYNGRPFSEFGVFADLSQTLGSPEKDYDFISIPGRNGDLSIFNNKYKDIEFTVHCYIKNDFVQNYRNLIDFMNESHGYLRFETSKEPDYYREALFLGEVNPIVRPFNRNGSFDVAFRCHPQRWLKEGERFLTFTDSATQSDPATLYNLTLQTAKPIIRVYGSGVVSVGGSTFTISDTGTYSYIEIDCENGDAYYKNPGSVVNLNDKFSGYFPALKPGDNNIFLIGPTKIEIQPRWFKI